ncbi:MAG: substrate-binding domain-containing protein [Lactobacillus panisapium]
MLQPLGFVAINDSLAVNIILLSRDININVPKELKVIGLDNVLIAQ